MAPPHFHDDGLSAGGDTTSDGAAHHKGPSLLTRLFASCEGDAAGSVHRAWAMTVLLAAAFFAIACVEGERGARRRGGRRGRDAQ